MKPGRETFEALRALSESTRTAGPTDEELAEINSLAREKKLVDATIKVAGLSGDTKLIRAAQALDALRQTVGEKADGFADLRKFVEFAAMDAIEARWTMGVSDNVKAAMSGRRWP